MRLTQALLVAVVLPITLFGAIGCKTVKIKDGRVPQEYLSEAKKVEGVYRGEFNGVSGELIISFQGNKPVVTYRNSRGSDILNGNCRSSIGDLYSVTVKGSKNDPEISKALFRFDAGTCSLNVQGRDLALNFKDTNDGMRVKVSLLREINERRDCRWVPGAPPHSPPYQDCTWYQDPVYLYGTFYR